MSSDVMTLPEVAEYLRLTEKTTYRLAADGTLPGFKAGGSWRFRQIDIDAWIEAKKAETRQSVRPEQPERALPATSSKGDQTR